MKYFFVTPDTLITLELISLIILLSQDCMECSLLHLIINLHYLSIIAAKSQMNLCMFLS